ncbi:GAF domain-containing protein [Stackebrandtia nassauensis]
MAFEATSRLITAPPDPHGRERAMRLRQLGVGLGQREDPRFDEFARRLAQIAGAPIGGVNFIDETQQYFAGMYAPTGDPDNAAAAPLRPEDPSRIMDREQGYCPHVVVRGKALVLEDVCDYPRFAGDPSVDDMGVRSYMAAPLIDRTGTVLGTVCAADVDIHPWGRRGLEIIKTMAAEVVDYVHRREGLVR